MSMSPWAILLPSVPVLPGAVRAPLRAAQLVRRRDGTLRFAAIDARLAQAATLQGRRGD